MQLKPHDGVSKLHTEFCPHGFTPLTEHGSLTICYYINILYIRYF